MISSRSPASGGSSTWKSSTTISADRPAERWRGPASTAWSHGCALARSVRCLCFDASRLARNGRDWHHLLELCGLVEARVIDLDGVYNPCRPNDRLLLGMKGSISEFELGVLASANAGRRPLEGAAEASCGYPSRSATSGIAKSDLVSTLTCGSRK